MVYDVKEEDTVLAKKKGDYILIIYIVKGGLNKITVIVSHCDIIQEFDKVIECFKFIF